MSRPPLERQIHSLLTDSNISLASAESCSGGLIAYRVTSIAGSSAYFSGSVVAYSNDLKQRLLGVTPETLERFGAVSEACAREMADGIRSLSGATIGVSTTGIAGPGGSTARKPVGLIYIACSSPLGTDVHEARWRGDRERNMIDAAEYAMKMVIDTAERIQAATDR